MKDNRENKRVKCSIPCTLIYNNKIYYGNILNLSDYGCEINLKEGISIDSLCAVTLNFSLTKNYLIQGRVIKNISSKDKRVKFIYKNIKDKVHLNHELYRIKDVLE